MERALEIAKEHAKIAANAEVELVVFPPKKSILEVVANPLGRSSETAALAGLVGPDNARALTSITAPLRLFRRGEPLTLMPNVFVNAR
jgi:hypothetical protein